MSPKAFQDCYPDDVAHCFGCGHLNRAGHQIKTHWDGERTITRFTPRRCVTGSLEIRYVAPTPLGPELEIRGFIEQVKGRKVVVRSELYAEGVLCVTGQAVVIEMPAGMAGKA